MDRARPAPPTGDLAFLRALLAPRRKLLLRVLVLLAAGNILGLAQPVFLQVVLDQVVLRGRTALLSPLCAAMAAAIVLRLGANVLQRHAFTRLSGRLLLDLRLRLLRKLQGLSLRWFAATPLGEVLARVNRDAAAVEDLAAGAVLGLSTSLLSLGLLGAILLAYDWRLCLLGLSPFPAALLASRLAAPRLRRLTRELRERSAASASFFTETIGAMRAVQADGREVRERRRFTRLHRQGMDTLLSFQTVSQVAAGIAGALVASGSVLVVAVGASWAAAGRLSPGVLVAQAIFLGMAYSPLRSLLELYLRLQEGRVSIERVREYLALEPGTRDGGRRTPRPLRGEIRFDGVTFGHRPEEPILRDASFTIGAGLVTALVGPTGIGKSTAIDLILRFYDPDRGALLADGVDLRELRLRSWRRQVALAGQDPFIFRGSLLENVAFGRPGAGEEEVREALRWARIGDLAGRLPRGLEEPLGEEGARLSGGERQRIALARAVLRRPRILILDEATSALDGLTEKGIRDSLARLRTEGWPGASGQGDGLPVTVLLVTHRIPALGFADRILVLDGGAIAAEGTHEELLAREGLYRRMWDASGSPARARPSRPTGTPEETAP